MLHRHRRAAGLPEMSCGGAPGKPSLQLVSPYTRKTWEGLLMPCGINSHLQSDLTRENKMQDVRPYLHEIALGKYARRKRATPKKTFDRVMHCIEVGKSTRFKPGQLLGEKSPLWKGGPFAKYGLSVDGYNAILKAQGGACAICKKPPKKRRLNVDHNHKTGRIRGLLCFRCNYGLGWFQDDGERLVR